MLSFYLIATDDEGNEIERELINRWDDQQNRDELFGLPVEMDRVARANLREGLAMDFLRKNGARDQIANRVLGRALQSVNTKFLR